MKDWHPKIKWERELVLRAETYTPDFPDLFPGLVPIRSANPQNYHNNTAHAAKSPGGNWLYSKQILPKGQKISTYKGSAVGWVEFDDDIVFPSLFRKDPATQVSFRRWNVYPMMSLTPMEVFSLRPGTRKAKGHTVLCGLGLGYQLAEVCKKSSVTDVTVIEESQDLVDWIFPKLDFLNKDVNVIVGDAWSVLPGLSGDVLLLDIFPSYGSNHLSLSRLDGYSSNFGTIWAWGSANIPSS